MCRLFACLSLCLFRLFVCSPHFSSSDYQFVKCQTLEKQQTVIVVRIKRTFAAEKILQAERSLQQNCDKTKKVKMSNEQKRS